MEDEKRKGVLIQFKELLQRRFFDKQALFPEEINYLPIEGYCYGNIKKSKN